MSIKNFFENQIFGNWKIIKPYLEEKNKALCICLLCNNEYKVYRTHLRQGASKQCFDCYKKQMKDKPFFIRHGMTGTKVYKTWRNMMTRILNPQGRDIKNYQNIKISDDWLVFENFYRDMGNPPEGERYSIGRIDNKGDYCKENCRWETDIQQANNTSRTHWITYKGETHSMMEWSRIMNINYSVLRSRLRYGWDIKDALMKEVINN